MPQVVIASYGTPVEGSTYPPRLVRRFPDNKLDVDAEGT